MENNYKRAFTNLNKNVFQYLLLLYLIILVIREFNKEVLNFLNLNLILIIVMVLGVITILTYKPKIEKQKVRRIDHIFVYFLGIVGMILVYIKIKDIGWISYLISVLSGILIIVLSKLVMKEQDEEEI